MRHARRRLLVAGVFSSPLAVLFMLNLVDELDRVAFAVLSPEIREAFGLTDSGIVSIGAAAGVTALLAALPMGVLADRVHRVRLAAGGAVAWSAGAVLTALAPAVWVLVLARAGAGIGRIVNEPVHASLLTDIYPPHEHPRVFALHRLATPLGLVSALAIGVLGAAIGWRAAFVLLALPTLLVIPLLLRLPEPPRRHAAVTAALPALGVRAARRRLAQVPTLRRLWLPLPVLGVAVITLPQLASLFFERVYDYGPTGRGVVAFLAGAGTIVGLAIGDRLGTRALATDRPGRLATIHGLSVASVGVCLGLMVLSPWPALSALCYLVSGIGIGAYQPCFFTLTCLVAPSMLRGQALAYSILLLGIGGLLSPLLAVLGSAAGYRVSLGVLAVSLLVGGLMLCRAAPAVALDALAARPDPLEGVPA